MLLNCPQCHMSATYVGGDFAGKWVVCHHCEVPFAWQAVRADDDARRADGTVNQVRVNERAQ